MSKHCGFNEAHPELQEGERFYGNCMKKNPNFRLMPGTEECTTLIYKTKRKGGVAYSRTGECLVGMFPVFISKEEFEDVELAHKNL